ncbi:thioredoxin-like domain-containing protein [Mucilaginibacter sp. Mucisp84]|uniref:thioredoxin-like domain-containing protein n=1 Tax=Mucilaginibacter sp. Mucisp84 TaxID=3243058 RepID=UPI0039A64157
MKKPYYLILLILISLFSCKRNNGVTIKGDIRGLKSKWVYYKPVFPQMVRPSDSAKVTDGKFEFNFQSDTAFFANLVSISYLDEKGIRKPIAVANPYEHAKNHSKYTDFVLGPGLTTITGDFSKNTGAVLNGGTQTDFYLRNITLPFIQMSEDGAVRNKQAARIERIIKRAPDAYWTLYAFNNLRFYFNHKELKSFYAMFGNEAKSSYYGRRLKLFIDNQPLNQNQFVNSIFADQEAKPVTLIDNTKKLNMVIFWASWCGPCRREIPSLRRITEQFSKDDVRFVSVSLDAKKENWLQALKKENMSWQQLIIPQQEYVKAQAQYNLSLIPKIYLVNNKNVIVKKIDGFDDGNEDRVKTFIADYLSKN